MCIQTVQQSWSWVGYIRGFSWVLISRKITIFGRPFVKRFAVCYRTVVCPVLSVCDVGVLWPRGWMDQDETWHVGRSRPRQHCVRWGRSSPFPKGAPPIFSPCLLWPNHSATVRIIRILFLNGKIRIISVRKNGFTIR